MKQMLKSNIQLKQVVSDLYSASVQQKSGLWKRIAEDLQKPTRQRRLVNLFSLDMHSKDGEVVIVPGKVLGTGDINHKVTVAAFSFSESAVQKIRDAKGTVMTIHELLMKNPKGKDVRVLG